MRTEELNQNYCVVWWTATDCPRKAAEAAFADAGHGDITLASSPTNSLRSAASQAVKKLGLSQTIKLFPLSGDSQAVACEVREFIKGEKQNDLPFICSFGVGLDHRVKLLSPGSLTQQQQIDLGGHVDELYQVEINQIDANDLTRGISEVVRRSAGAMLLDCGRNWYLPVEKLAAYEAIADSLRGYGVNMVVLRFGPECNSQLLLAVRAKIEEQSEEILNKTEAELSALLAAGKKPRANGVATRFENLARLSDTLKVNERVLGDAADRLRKSIERIRLLMGDAATDVFA